MKTFAPKRHTGEARWGGVGGEGQGETRTQTHKHPCRCLAMAQQLSRSAHAFPLTRPPLEKLVLLSLAEAGASQPVRKMAGYADMTALNKSSGKVATFAVRVVGARTSEYTFTSKRDTKPVTQHKFEAWLIGINAQAYCVGFIKGSQATVKQAQEKYVEGSVWALSKVVFDSYTAITFVSTPVPFRLDVAKSKMEPIENNELCKQMPQDPVPPRSVADTARITSKRSTDLIAIVKDFGELRTTKSGLVVADVTLIDNSESSAGVLATIKVGVFGETMSASKMILLRDHVGDPMVFFNLSVNFANGQLSVTHFAGDVVRLAPVCQKTKALGDQKDTLTLATNTSTLTAEWTPQQSRDVSGPVPLSCAAFLDFTAESPEAKMPEVVQVMWVHLEEPEPDTSVRDPSGERVWFRTPLRDASGATTVGVSQKVALELANCESMQAFLDRHAAAELNLPLLCHVRITRTYKEVSGGASQPTRYVNHTVASVTPMQWSPIAAPNEAYRDVLPTRKASRSPFWRTFVPTRTTGLASATTASRAPCASMWPHCSAPSRSPSRAPWARASRSLPRMSKTSPTQMHTVLLSLCVTRWWGTAR